jgi:hypothetical protein
MKKDVNFIINLSIYCSKQQPQSSTQQTSTLTDAKQNVEVKVEAPKTPVEESKPPMTSSLLGDTATKETDKAWTDKVSAGQGSDKVSAGQRSGHSVLQSLQKRFYD